MKFFQSILILFLFFSTNIQSQTWFPDDAKWQFFVSGGFIPINEVFEYKIIGDTLLDGQAGKIIMGGQYPILEILYEETKQVFKWSDFENEWKLIYDFNLEAGDQFIGQVDYEIIETGTVSIYGEDRLSQKISWDATWQNDTLLLVEGIGAIGSETPSDYKCSHLFPELWICASPVDGYDFKFHCYEENGMVYDPFDLCLTATKSNEIADEISIYPSPAMYFFSIKNKLQNVGIQKVLIYNIQGVLIRYLEDSFENIPISDFADGLYFVEIYDKTGNSGTKKLLVQR